LVHKGQPSRPSLW